jgi:hypothetical protein
MIKGNLGQTSLPNKRRATDPMKTYDALPQALRFWLAGAALPWSPRSCKRIWEKAHREGLGSNDVLERLTRAELKALTRDRVSNLKV